MKLLKQLHWPEFETMALLLALWLCILPFIALVVVPVIGNRVGVAIALGLLIVMMIICWILCIPAAIRFAKQQTKRSKEAD